jgi:hypothetical protein
MTGEEREGLSMSKRVFSSVLIVLVLLLVAAPQAALAAGDTGANTPASQSANIVSLSQAPAPFLVLIGLIFTFCLLVAVLPMFVDVPEGLNQ